ncbi:hypothetical protein [Sulfuriflexus sp.]|uniref:hypothetical protein n=1 Tax=Sulfuriflexus sp. TaxID=2015443 RepID=UPI0028CCEDF5|nr:hypothetical protein [Sulfuriflexus sp.]MDT8405478.1 hypothetical protein [Sulfuriflexus sp.]
MDSRTILFNIRKSNSTASRCRLPAVLSYWDFLDTVSADLLKSEQTPSIDAVHRLGVSYGFDEDVAAEHTEKFLVALSDELKRQPEGGHR